MKFERTKICAACWGATSGMVVSTILSGCSNPLVEEIIVELVNPANVASSRLPDGQTRSKPSGLKVRRRKNDFQESSYEINKCK